MTWKQWLIKAIQYLSDTTRAKHEAEILLKKVIGVSKERLLTFCETRIYAHQYFKLENLLIRRKLGEPIAYLIGEKEFWSLNLKVTSDTFIPRPDTECIVEHAMHLFPSEYPTTVLDLGTGTGAIALALGSERPKWEIIGIDIKNKAVTLACKNAYNLNIKNVNFFHSNWFRSLKGTSYNLIISNPPYVSAHDVHLLKGDVRFEPRDSLIARNNGLENLKKICYNSQKYLRYGGWLILEHGWNQGKFVRSYLTKSNFTCIKTFRDYGNNERISLGKANTGIIPYNL